MGKAAQEKVRFRWYDMTRFEVSNKVGDSVAKHLHMPGLLSAIRADYSCMRGAIPDTQSG